jgi:hypothetical protein
VPTQSGSPSQPRFHAANLADERARVALGAADHDHAWQEGPLDLVAVASNLLAPTAQYVVLVADLLDGAAHVPHVRVAGDGSQSLSLASAADQYRQPLLHGRRLVHDLTRRVEARPARPLALEHPAHDPHRLVQPVEAFADAPAEIKPVATVLELEPRPADAEDGATA